MEGKNLEKPLQEGNLYRQLNCLIVAHLRHHNLTQAARAVASATMTPLDVEAPPDKLLELVAKWRKMRHFEGFLLLHCLIWGQLWVMAQIRILGFLLLISALHRILNAQQRVFQSPRRGIFQSTRCARFSTDGRFVATGSADTSIKLFDISKIKQMMLPDSKDGPVRPVIRTFYDHAQVLLIV
ncbi:hypothetical protein V6N13_026793 [Hibiscus sabdariffa]